MCVRRHFGSNVSQDRSDVVVVDVVSNTNFISAQTKFIHEPLKDFTLIPETQTQNVGFVNIERWSARRVDAPRASRRRDAPALR